MATRKDVAQRAGVSAVTVSYVINNTKHVTPEVKARVEEAVRELHYTPNLVARGLVTRRTQHVAMFVNNLRNPHYAEMLAGAQSVASRKGYIVSIIMIDYSNEEEVLRLAARGVDGAILATADTTATAGLLEGRLPYAAAGDYVDIRYREAVREAVRSLQRHGHRRIAFLSGFHLSRPEHIRYQYLREAMAECGVPINEKLMIDGNVHEDTNEEAGVWAIRRLLETGEPFTAVMALNDVMAFGVMRELHSRGLRVPEDVSVIGCDNVGMSRYYIPQLSTIDSSSFEVGKQLMRVLIRRIEKKQETGRTFEAVYRERESVGDCRERE